MNKTTYKEPLHKSTGDKKRLRPVSLSAGLLVSVLATGGFSQAVDAQEWSVDHDELLHLYEQYTALEGAREEANTTVEEETERTAATLTDEETEELGYIKNQLIKMIEMAGGQAVLDQLANQTLSYEQLDAIFTGLLENQLQSADQAVEVDETEEVKELEEVEETEEMTDEVVTELETDLEETAETENETNEIETVSLAVEMSDEPVEEPEVDESAEAEELTEENSDEPVETIEEDTEEETEDESEETIEEAPKVEAPKTETPKQEAPKVEAPKTETPKTEAPKQTEKPAEKAIVHVVKSGDTLNKIAQQYGTTVNKIASLNNLTNVNRISVGQSLAINEAGKTQAQKPTPNLPGNLEQAKTPQAFVNQIAGFAQQVAQEHGLYASVMIAQASLESGYGTSRLSTAPNHNLFGIKGSYEGQSVAMQTREYYSNTGWITITDHFKKYPSYEESLRDNARLLRRGTSWNPQFYSGTWVENTKSYRDATAWLEGRYATDPTYANKLNNLIQLYNLTQYDAPSNGVTQPNPNPNPKPTPTPSPQTPVTPPANNVGQTTSYTVVRGDTLSKIAREYKTTVQALKAANNLKTDLIFVGQQLAVPVIPSQSQPVQPTPSKPETPAPSKPEETVKPETPAPVETPNRAEGDGISYTVSRGDTLSHLAVRFKTTVAAIREANQLTGDLIYVNQTLVIPGTSAPEQPVETVKPDTNTQQPVTNQRYVVKAGDTLSAIARTHKTSVNQLKELNSLSSDRIYVGQQLMLPKGLEEQTKPAPEKDPVVAPETPQGQGSYTVKAGDTLSHIAVQNKTTVARLKEMNSLQSDLIRVGQRLIVPSTTQPTTPASPVKETTPVTDHYLVARGDTLSKIAREFNTTVAQLKQDNHLTSDVIYIGQKLLVSGVIQQPVSKPAPEPVKPTGSYVVVSGDTLSQIARHHQTTVGHLMTWNKLDNADRLFIGQSLVVTSTPEVKPVVPTPTKPETTPSTNKGVTYTVVAGDTLSQIARNYQTTVANLRELNKLDHADRIFVGQQLQVTANQGSTPLPVKPEEKPVGQSSSYKVKAGDTLSQIAREYNVTIAQLKEWNKLTSDIIFVNQELRIQTSKTESTTKPSSPVGIGETVKSTSYTVRRGDTLSHIARTFNTTVQSLREWNHLKTDLIFVDQNLTIMN